MIRLLRTRSGVAGAFVLTVGLLLAACTSGSNASTPTGSQAYARALAALAHAPRVGAVGSTLGGSQQSVRFEVGFDGSDSSATLHTGAELVDVRVVDKTRYLETNTAVWTELGLSSYSAHYADRWFAFPAGPPALLGGMTTVVSGWLDWAVRSRASQTIFAGFVPTGSTVRARVGGISCLRITSANGQQLYVAGADFRPVRYVAGARAETQFRYPSSTQTLLTLAPTSASVLPPAPHTAG